GRSVLANAPRCLQVHADDRVEVVLCHREDHAVTQDAGVVDDDVERAVGLDGLVDDALGAVVVGDIVVVGDGLAPAAANELGDLLGRPLVGALAGDRAAQVVDDDLRALGGELAPIANFAKAVKDDNPLYSDSGAAKAAGFDGAPAPPTFGFALEFWGRYPDLQQGLAPVEGNPMMEVIGKLMQNGGLILHGEQEFEYHRPIVAGD